MGRGSCVRSLALTAGSDGSGVCVGVAGGPEAEERKAQRSYWEEHSRDLTLEGMMLDSRAAELDKEERPEVMLRLLFFLQFSFCLFNDSFLPESGEHERVSCLCLCLPNISVAVSKRDAW